MRTGLPQLLAAGTDKRPVLRWAGHEIRRYRRHLYLLDAAGPDEQPPVAPLDWSGAAALHLGGCRGTLSLRPYALRCRASAAPDWTPD
ncbi:MAG: TilS substrate-binding domain-containing protein [Gammaproteobacteria bacterium]